MLLFADATTVEIASIAGVILVPVSALLTALWVQFKKTNAERLVDKDAEKAVWKAMALEGAANLERATNAKLATEGKPAIVPIAPVVGERQSPMTPKQRETAEMATVRARLTRAALEINTPARTETTDAGQFRPEEENVSKKPEPTTTAE
jgi:crotonobetainyl-CoA:carnitine CoA-transferase CaiB-like acyl-CoA transferase